MEQDPYSECERDKDGNVLDPIYYNAIPPERIIVIREGRGKWCMDVRSLYENVIVYKDNTNPLTRSKLSDDVLTAIGEYRLQHIVTVVIIENDKDILSDIVSIVLDDVYLVGDLYISCVEAARGTVTRMRVIFEDKYLDDIDLDTPVYELTQSKLVVVRIARENITGTNYGKVKDFTAKYDRYKYKFSPFPEEVRPMIRPSIGEMPYFLTPYNPLTMRRPRLDEEIIEQQSRSWDELPTYMIYTRSPSSLDLINPVVERTPLFRPLTEGLVWAPARKVFSRWLWTLVVPGSVPPPNYQGQGMSQNTIDAIRTYNNMIHQGNVAAARAIMAREGREINYDVFANYINDGIPLPDPSLMESYVGVRPLPLL